MSSDLRPSGLGRTRSYSKTEAQLTATELLEGGITGDTTLDDLVGAGLEINAQTLRLLATIWDGSEIVADVNNQATVTEQLNNAISAAEKASGGVGSSADPFVISDSDLWEDGRLYQFPGWGTETTIYETPGLNWPTLDYESTAIYLEGYGIRLSELKLQDNADAPVVKIDADGNTGNFGGISDMKINGNRSNNASGEGIKGEDIIDILFENLIVRTCVDDCIRLNGSGMRLRNCWVENSTNGHNVSIFGGERCKIVNVHTGGAGSAGKYAIHASVDESYIAGVSGFSVDRGLFVANRNTVNGAVFWNTTSRGAQFNSNNTISNVLISDELNGNGGLGIFVNGSDNVLSNIRVFDVQDRGIRLEDDRNQLFNAQVRDWGASAGGQGALRIAGSECLVNGFLASSPTYGANRVIEVASGSNNRIFNFRSLVGGNIEISSGVTNTVINGLSGVSLSNITDNGTRTVINGVGANAGSPASGGDWNGNAEFAANFDVTVLDTNSTTPYDRYEAQRDGGGGYEWVQVSASAA